MIQVNFQPLVSVSDLSKHLYHYPQGSRTILYPLHGIAMEVYTYFQSIVDVMQPHPPNDISYIIIAIITS